MPRSVEAQERREQILRAAVAVFSERGYAQATISDIAAAAGLAHGTIYLYFRSKAEIFQTLVDWFGRTLLDSFADSTAASPAENTNDIDRPQPGDLATELYHLFHRALATCSAYPRLAEVSLRMARDANPDVAPAFSGFQAGFVARLRLRIARAVEAQEIREVNPGEAAHIVVQLLGTAIECLLAQGANGDPDRIARGTVDFILFGLAGQNTRNNLEQASVSVSGAPLTGQSVGEVPAPRGSRDRRDERPGSASSVEREEGT